MTGSIILFVIASFFCGAATSLGIAIMATMLTRFMKVEKAVLSEHVTTISADVQARLDLLTRGVLARGFDPATAKQIALAILDRQLQARASVLAFSKIYLFSGIILLCSRSSGPARDGEWAGWTCTARTSLPASP